MSRKDKLYAKALSSPADIKFNDLCKLAELVGFILRRTVKNGGSHNHHYRHPTTKGIMTFQPDKHGKANAYQVRQLLKHIEEHELMEGQ
jgi:hypothetical protein